MNRRSLFIILSLAGLLVWACTDQGRLVGTMDELNLAIATAKPGETITLRNGVWRDAEILFEANGEPDKPIRLVAETDGQVIISGQSNLVLAGNYLHVQGLVFKDGYSPTGSVISFRKDRDNLANHSRVTQVVIDRFNKPDRFEPDIWVTLFGKHNSFDRNHLVGKMNQGVTLAVRLDTEASQENHHIISHNYFGPRPVLGSNGGETLRIGTSHYSLTDSLTRVENNVFDQCDGEVEIISVKSGKNVLKNNLFYESAGTLTLRHGNGNLVEGNVFIGNNKPHTGGIRVINAQHVIRNNYLENLTGHRFGGGLVVMNGVPNSPINRYHPVHDVKIENNTLVNVDHIQLAAGADAERSQAPADTLFANNLLVATRADTQLITAYDDISGISFAHNGVQGFEPTVAVDAVSVTTQQTAGRTQDANATLGATALAVPSLDDVGVAWYPKGDLRPKLGQGRVISVTPGYMAIEKALRAAAPGDTLGLAAGDYTVERLLEIPFPVSFVGAGKDSTRIQYTRNALFEIQDGGSLSLASLTIDGAISDDTAGNTVIRTSRYGMLNNYRLLLEQVRVENLDINHSYSFLKASKSTMADTILLAETEFSQVTGDLLRLDVELDDLGIFNVDYLTITDSVFNQVAGRVASVYRGGTDESTFGPHVDIHNSRFYASGAGKRNANKSVIELVGAQYITVANSVFTDSGRVLMNSQVGEPVYSFSNNQWGQQLPQIKYRGEPVSIKELVASE